MIATEYSNSTDVTAATIAAQQAERDIWNRDFAAGQRKFRQGMSLIYCANSVERAGFWDAADQDAAELAQERDHADFVRSLSY